MTYPVVFLDFAGPDDTALGGFYSPVFGWDADEQGKFVVPVSGAMQCAIRKDPAGNPMGLVEMDGDKPRIP